MYIDCSNILNFVVLVTAGTLSGCLCVLFCFWLLERFSK